MQSRIDFQILATLTYTNQFKFPLSESEIYYRLVGVFALKDVKKFKKESESKEVKKKISVSLKKLVRQNLLLQYNIKNKNKWYSLPGESIFSLRKKRETHTQLKQDEIKQVINFMSKIRWVKAVGLTGAMAMNNPSSVDDDIDFIVVTQKNRLWLTRVIILFFSWAKGKKSFVFGNPDKWCFNLWLDESNLLVPKTKHSLYTAYEVMQINWLLDRSNIKKKFSLKNDWVVKFLPNYQEFMSLKNKKTKIITNSLGFLSRLKIQELFFSFANWFFFLLQRVYLEYKVKIAQDDIKISSAYLHKPLVTKKYDK